MRRALPGVLLFLAATAFAAPPLFTSASESKWSVAKDGAAAGTLTLLTGTNGTRAEYRAKAGAPVAVYLGGNGKVWLRATGGDIELATISAASTDNTVAPALLLPFTTTAADAVDAKDGKPASYRYRGAKATYTYDAKGPSKIEIATAGEKYVLTRTSLGASSADASNFAVRPKKGAASRLARLSGDLLGPSDTSVSATAGGRGAGTQGLKLKDGGDYATVEKIEKRDAAWKAKMDAALAEFQKDGQVGKSRENQ